MLSNFLVPQITQKHSKRKMGTCPVYQPSGRLIKRRVFQKKWIGKWDPNLWSLSSPGVTFRKLNFRGHKIMDNMQAKDGTESHRIIAACKSITPVIIRRGPSVRVLHILLSLALEWCHNLLKYNKSAFGHVSHTWFYLPLAVYEIYHCCFE
jgi:hypothetical protein